MTDLTHLTPRELEVLRLIGRGMDNHEIAEALVVTVATVKSHINRLFLKMEVRDRAQAVIVAYEAGVVTVGDGSTHGLTNGAAAAPKQGVMPDPESTWPR